MKSPIDQLREMAPARPVAAGTEAQWQAVEAQFQFRFPPDYREFIDLYGHGRFTDFFGFPSPFYSTTSRGGSSFEKFIRQRMEGVEYVQQRMPQHVMEFPLHPKPNGLFPFGYTDNGGTLLWLTAPDVQDYQIICARIGYTRDFDTFNMGMVEFIVKWLRQEIEVPSLTPPDLFPYDGPLFEPAEG